VKDFPTRDATGPGHCSTFSGSDDGKNFWLPLARWWDWSTTLGPQNVESTEPSSTRRHVLFQFEAGVAHGDFATNFMDQAQAEIVPDDDSSESAGRSG